MIQNALVERGILLIVYLSLKCLITILRTLLLRCGLIGMTLSDITKFGHFFRVRIKPPIQFPELYSLRFTINFGIHAIVENMNNTSL